MTTDNFTPTENIFNHIANFWNTSPDPNHFNDPNHDLLPFIYLATV